MLCLNSRLYYIILNAPLDESNRGTESSYPAALVGPTWMVTVANFSDFFQKGGEKTWEPWRQT